MPEYELSAVRLITKRSIEGDGAIGTKHVHLDAFGKKLKLNLKDNDDFNDRIKDMKVFIAETENNGNLRYREDPSASVSDNNKFSFIYIFLVQLFNFCRCNLMRTIGGQRRFVSFRFV